MLEVCLQVVDKFCSRWLFPVVVTSLKQTVNNLYVMLDGIIRLVRRLHVLTTLLQSWCNKNVTRFTTQGCNNTVISWVYRTCWNNLVKLWLLQVVNSLFQTCSQLETSSANVTCWQTCYKMWDFCMCGEALKHRRETTKLCLVCIYFKHREVTIAG
jgi:hypothetical protein